MLLIHILVAVSSLAVAGAAFIKPGKSLLNASYALISLTIATGTSLVFISHVSILHLCMAGLIYSAAAIYGTVMARRKLEAIYVRNK